MRNRKGEFKKELSDLIKKGYIRFRIDDEIYTSENLPTLKKNFKHNIEVVVDRIQIDEKYKSRISQSIETALNLSDGIIYFYDVENSINHIFSSRFSCPISGFTIEEIEPRLFSFNSPNGACNECDGLGFKEKFDPDLIIGNENLSMIEGVILPWNKNNQFYKDLILEVCKHCSVNPREKWKEILKDKKKLIMFGDSKNLSFFNSYNGWNYNEEYLGVIGFLEKKLKRSDMWQREELGKYMNKFCVKLARYQIEKRSIGS